MQVETGQYHTISPVDTSILSSGKPNYNMDASHQSVTAVGLEGNDDGMEVKTEAPVVDSVKSELAATDAPKSAAGPPGGDALYPSGLLQAILIVALLLAMFLVALDMVRAVMLFQCSQASVL